MNTINKSSQEIGHDMAVNLLSMPLGMVPLHIEGVIASLVEGVRCENIPVGIVHRGCETLRNGTIRLHCAKGQQFIIPHWEKEALQAVKSLIHFHDLEKLEAAAVRQMIQTKVNGNGAKISV